MNIVARLLGVLTLSYAGAAHASGDPCAAGTHASPLTANRGHLVITRDIAAYVARHAEIACTKLDAFLRDAAPGDARAVAEARIIQGELATGVLRPIFRLYPELRDRDLTAADAPGATVKIGPPGAPPNPRQMGSATAQHLRWVSSDAQRRFLDLVEPIASASPGSKASAHASEVQSRANAIAGIEDISSEISFVDAPALRNYPQLWKLTVRELEARMPEETRSAKSDAAFRAAAPPPGSVKLSAAAAARLRTFAAAMKREAHGCQVLSILWALSTASRGPDDPAWRETGPSLEIGTYGCGRVPPEAIQTIDGIKLLISSDKDHSFAGKTIDYVDKKFVLK